MKALNGRQNKIQEYFIERKTAKVKDILSIFPHDVVVERRTIIRDLEKLCSMGFIVKYGKGRGVYYGISDSHILFKNIDIEKYFSIPFDGREIKQKFNLKIFDIIDRSLFLKEEEDELNKLHETFQKNFSHYDSQTIINKELERILIEFSWKSSQIEGNTYSLLSTELLIKENQPDETKTKKETQMILNHKDAFNEILQNKKRFLNLSSGDIEYVHSLLTKKLGVAKNFRSLPVGITGTKYQPLDNQHQVTEMVGRMVDTINHKNNFFEKSFLVLVLLSYIQAFEDGNKRTARMISNAVLLAYNSIPMSYRAINEVEYKKAAILFYEQNNLSYFKEIFMTQFAFAVKNYFK